MTVNNSHVNTVIASWRANILQRLWQTRMTFARPARLQVLVAQGLFGYDTRSDGVDYRSQTAKAGDVCHSLASWIRWPQIRYNVGIRMELQTEPPVTWESPKGLVT